MSTMSSTRSSPRPGPTRPSAKALDVGSGTLTPIRSVVEEIVRLLRPSVEPRFGALPDRPKERVRVADIERTQALPGLGTAYTAQPGARRHSRLVCGARGCRVRVLVTGHHGYIGSVLAPALREAGHEVVGLDTFYYRGCDFGDGSRVRACRSPPICATSSPPTSRASMRSCTLPHYRTTR